MGQSGQNPWRFSPLAVVAESLAFVAANLPDIARWAVAPLVFGLGFRFFMPDLPEGGENISSLMPALLLLALVLLWIRVPLELRLCRKVLLNETPSHFYGLELVEKRTWTFMLAYVRVICLFVAGFGMALLLAAMLAAPLANTGLAAALPGAAGSAAPVLGAFSLLGLLYVLLAPRVVLIFPDVALDGAGRLFHLGAPGETGKRARWRMVAVMALIWAPEYLLTAASFLGDGAGWWKDVASSWPFALGCYLIGFATLVVSAVAGSVMYRLLRERTPSSAPVSEARTFAP